MLSEKKVFISYSRADSAVVFPLVERLQKAVGDVFWMDLNGIESGDQFVDVIIDAIDKTEIVLFMHSASSLGSEWVKKEIQYAQGMKKKIVPILVDGNSLRGWFLFHSREVLFLGHYQTYDELHQHIYQAESNELIFRIFD